MRTSFMKWVIFVLITLLILNVLVTTPVVAASSLAHVPLTPPTGWSGADLYGIWGSGSNNVYAVGTAYGATEIPVIYHNTGTGWTSSVPVLPTGLVGGYLTDIWGSSPSDVYAVGFGSDGGSNSLPLLYHNDGTDWVGSSLSIPTGLIEGVLLDTWGIGGHVYAVGYGRDANSEEMPLFYHNDGTGWTEVNLSLLPGMIGGWLSGMWGSSAGDLYLVGHGYDADHSYRPLYFHNDGTGWTASGALFPPAGLNTGSFSDIWGSSASDVYMVGHGIDGTLHERPFLYHYNGTGWTNLRLSLPDGWTDGVVNGIWGSSANDIYIAGWGYDANGHSSPLLYHNDGTGWSKIDLSLAGEFTDGFLYTVWGGSASELYIAGDAYPGTGGSGMPLLYQQNTADVTAPVVTTIVRASTNHTSATAVNFTVTFSEPVLNVDANDFALTTSGSITGVAITNITGSGSTYTATVSTGTSNGLLGLRVPVGASITDAAGNPLAGLPFTNGQSYTILKEATFSDVETKYWAWQYVERLYNAKITGGCSNDPLEYCPGSTVTRAQMAIFLLKGIHGPSYAPPAVGGDTGFSDVETTHWAAAWIKQLAVEKITGGCATGKYCPEGAVTRAQMAIFLLKAKHGLSYSPPAVGDSTGFGDVPTDHWAAAWIKQLAVEGITGGCGNGNYCPDTPVTRAQMGVFLVKTFNLP